MNMSAEPITVYQEGDDLALSISRQTPGRLFWYRFRRNKLALVGAFIITTMVVVAIFAPLLAPYSPYQQDLLHLTQPPSRAHLMGTDDLGRDVLSRIIFGARISVGAAIIPTLIALAVGVPLGLLTGYYRGILDDVVMRVVDAMQAFPFLILALALASTLGPGFLNAMIAIGIGFIPAFIRIVRGQVLSVAQHDYVVGAHAIGTTDTAILRRHVLPNALGPLLIQISVAMAASILAEAGLSFLGLGVQPPTASWGQMLTIAQTYIYSVPSLALWPGLAIFLAVLGFNLLGDGIRDGLDPRSS
jgi:peptide/nickel transport system permease protein